MTGDHDADRPITSVTTYLETPRDGRPWTAPPGLWGFGGLQGGLVLASLAEHARSSATPGSILRGVSGRFHRPVRGEFEIEISPLRPRGRVTSFTAIARGDEGVLADATTVFGIEQPATRPRLAPAAPRVPDRQDVPVFPVPREFAPISEQVEIRVVGPTTPYGGHDEATLIAWVRLTDSEVAPDTARLLVLLDVLAPSYSAILTALTPLPTLELNVHPTNRSSASSPWGLVRAHTPHATGDGWVSEQFDAWDHDGTHLATATQLRIIRD